MKYLGRKSNKRCYGKNYITLLRHNKGDINIEIKQTYGLEDRIL